MDKNKLTLEQQFFSDKTLEFAKELYDQSEGKLKEVYNGQIKNRNNLLNQIAKILLSYNIDDNVLNINAADKKKLYSELSDLIVSNIKSELDVETSLTKDILTDVGKEKFNTNNYVYGLGADFKIDQLSDKVLEKIISTKVDDKLWSDRLYDNKNEICNVLQTEVEKFLKGETNVNQIGQKIINKYDINAHETKRLVQDNICRVQEEANDVWQHEHGIKKVMYMATLDGKVCSRCAKYDTEVFDTDEKPVQIPQHPFCRCVYISLPNKDWNPKMRLDNETKKNINWQSYQRWKEKENSDIIISKKIEAFKPAKTIQEAEEYAMTSLGISKASYKNVDVVTANEWNKGLKDSFDKFPALRDGFGFVGESHERNKLIKPIVIEKYLNDYIKSNPIMDVEVLKVQAEKKAENFMKRMSINKYEYAQTWFPKTKEFKAYSGITVNRYFGIDSEYFTELLKEDVELKFHPISCDTIKSVLDHEIGHQLDRLLNVSKNEEIIQLYDSMKLSEKTNNLSRYSWKNTNPNRYEEFIAEGWSEYCNNPKPRLVAKKIGETIERMYEDWEKKNI